jgi:hypothetical protein
MADNESVVGEETNNLRYYSNRFAATMRYAEALLAAMYHVHQMTQRRGVHRRMCFKH